MTPTKREAFNKWFLALSEGEKTVVLKALELLGYEVAPSGIAARQSLNSVINDAIARRRKTEEGDHGVSDSA